MLRYITPYGGLISGVLQGLHRALCLHYPVIAVDVYKSTSPYEACLFGHPCMGVVYQIKDLDSTARGLILKCLSEI